MPGRGAYEPHRPSPVAAAVPAISTPAVLPRTRMPAGLCSFWLQQIVLTMPSVSAPSVEPGRSAAAKERAGAKQHEGGSDGQGEVGVGEEAEGVEDDDEEGR